MKTETFFGKGIFDEPFYVAGGKDGSCIIATWTGKNCPMRCISVSAATVKALAKWLSRRVKKGTTTPTGGGIGGK